MARKDIGNKIDRENRNAHNDNYKELYKEVNDFTGSITDELYERIIDGAKLNWKEPVSSQSNLPSSAVEGDTRMARDTGKVYRYDGSKWVEIQQIDAGPVNELDSRLTSQLAQTASIEDVNNLDDQKADKASLSLGLATKRDKDVEIGMADLDQETREAMAGGSVPVVGEDSVGTINLKNNAVTRDALNNLALANIPWVSGASADLDYIWNMGASIVDSNVLNKPFSGQGFLTVDISKALSSSASSFVKQTISAIGTSPETWSRIMFVNTSTGIVNYIREWSKETNEVIEDDSITFDMLTENTQERLFSNFKSELGYRIVNMNWAQLENNFNYTLDKFVFYTESGGVHYRDNSTMLVYEPIPVHEGEVWRISTRSTNIPDWSLTARGVFLNGFNEFMGFVPVDDDDPKSGISTFIIPKGVTKMEVNALKHSSNQNQTHIMKLHDWKNIWESDNIGYSLNQLIENDGSVTPTELSIGLTNPIPVIPGEIYRIANVHSHNGASFTTRGVFLNELNEVVSPIPDNQEVSLPYQWNDVIIPAGATKMRVNFYYEIQTREDTSNSISINKAIPTIPKYSNDYIFLKGKVSAHYGDSTTWYGDWTRLIENATGLSTYNHGHSGASMSTYQGENTLCRDDRIENLMASSPDVVTILTGLNGGSTPLGSEDDLRKPIGEEDKTTFIGAYAYVIKKIFSVKPNVKIIIMTTSYHNFNDNNDAPNGTTGLTSLDFAKASKTVAEYFGIQLADTRHTTQFNLYTNNLMLSDNIHFSMRGAEAVAGSLLRELKNINWISA